MILLLKSYPYHFVRTILSVPFCPIPFCPYTILSIPFCPYHFVRYHFVLEPFNPLHTKLWSTGCYFIFILFFLFCLDFVYDYVSSFSCGYCLLDCVNVFVSFLSFTSARSPYFTKFNYW